MAAQKKKPKWAIEKDRRRRSGADRIWLFGLHAVRDALENPMRVRHRLIVTPNAQTKLAEAIATSGMMAEIADPRKFPAPLDPQSVHQGAALEADPLAWGRLEDLCRPHAQDPAPVAIALDRVTDPHNVGAILRSAEVFGARAVIAPHHHSAPETGALAKAASGALERQPYLRVRNLADALETLKQSGYAVIGLDGAAEASLVDAFHSATNRPICIVLGAEGPGLREKTRMTCDFLARISPAGAFGSLNVSNAAAVALYASGAKNT
ncbi:MAG: 23S rRNA (guanosine(2251)-2'-O)-methyltransferase RlmB [Pseudomonadota bacterium]